MSKADGGGEPRFSALHPKNELTPQWAASRGSLSSSLQLAQPSRVLLLSPAAPCPLGGSVLSPSALVCLQRLISPLGCKFSEVTGLDMSSAFSEPRKPLSTLEAVAAAS